MKKHLFKFLLLGGVILFIISCEQDGIKLKEPDLPEVLEVNQAAYNLFTQDYYNFVQSLDQNKKDILLDYIQNSIPKPMQKLTVDCNCQPEDRHCSAIGMFSECCICCPPPQSAACGVYFGIASCQCSGSNPIPRLQNTPARVTIYPRNIAGLIDFAEKKGINTVKIHNSLKILIKSIN